MVEAQALDAVALEYIGRHRIALMATLRQSFFAAAPNPQREVETLIRRLKERGLIRAVERAIPPYSVYVLSEKGAVFAGLPVSMAVPLRAGAPELRDLYRQLSVLWFCAFGDAERVVLNPKAVETLVGGAARAAQLVHVAEVSAKRQASVLLRAYVVGEATPVESALATMKKRCESLVGSQLEGPARKGRYVIQALCHRQSKTDELSARMGHEHRWSRVATSVGVENLVEAHRMLEAREQAGGTQ
ncbi:MAG: hypothetical protein AAFU73_15695 [Planctomycetota bacterium]